MLKLYDLDRSGNCYKVRLFLSILGLEYEKIPVDAVAGAGDRRRREIRSSIARERRPGIRRAWKADLQ